MSPEWVCPLFIVPCLIAFVYFLTAVEASTWGGRVYWSVSSAYLALARALGVPDPPPVPWWRGAFSSNGALSGKLLDGRAYSVDLAAKPAARRVQKCAVIEVDCDPGVELTVTLREDVFERFQRWRGKKVPGDVSVGDEAFEARLKVHSPTPAAVAPSLRAEVRREILLIFDGYFARRLELGAGKLRVQIGPAVPLQLYKDLVQHLGKVAADFDRTSLKIHVLDGERRVLSDAAGKARCAFCHEGVQGDEPDLVACERCQTVVHGECWTDHGGCPLMGCGSQRAERARGRGA